MWVLGEFGKRGEVSCLVKHDLRLRESSKISGNHDLMRLEAPKQERNGEGNQSRDQ